MNTEIVEGRRILIGDERVYISSTAGPYVSIYSVTANDAEVLWEMEQRGYDFVMYREGMWSFRLKSGESHNPGEEA